MQVIVSRFIVGIVTLAIAASAEYANHAFLGHIPHYIEPLEYTIKLTINLKKWVYRGSTTVLLNVSEPCDQIPIHSNGLNIVSVTMVRLNGYHQYEGTVDIAEVLEDKSEYMFLRIYPSYTLYPSLYYLRVTFNRTIRDTEKFGLYRSGWQDPGGWKNKIAVTHFSPDKAREAFPCFDEPRLKARFRFIIVHESVYTALSNAEIESRVTVAPGWVKSTFHRTSKISTYLTIVAISNYRYVESQTKSGKVTRVYGSPDNLKYSQTSLKLMSDCLDYLEEFFEFPYSFPKLYLFPVPDLMVGAMEQPGLITATHAVTSYNRARFTAFKGVQSKLILAHEIAHMWLGNLVTNEWWDSIHVKEGVVSWLMYDIIQHVDPEGMDIEDETAIIIALISAMKSDSGLTSRPILSMAKFRKDLMTLFDVISYYKGGMVTRMVKAVLGPKLFREALRTYVFKYESSTATTLDLVKVYQETASTKPFNTEEFLKRYILQKNYPLVTVKLLNRTHVSVRQERFLVDKNFQDDTPDDSPYNYTWHIPFTYTTDSHRNDKVLMLTEKESIVKLPKPSRWIKVNNDFKMFYRCHYEKTNWKYIYNQLLSNHSFFSTGDRIQLIDDLFALESAGMIDPGFPLELLSYLSKEKEFGPWKIAWENLYRIRLSASPASENALKVYIRTLLDGHLKDAVNWETPLNASTKNRILHNFFLEVGIEAGHKLAAEYIDNIHQINSVNDSDMEAENEELDYELQILQDKMEVQRDRDKWEELLLSLYHITDDTLLTRSCVILSSTKNKFLLLKLLKVSLDLEKNQKLEVALAVADDNPSMVWNFVKENYDIYYRTFGEDQFLMAFLLDGILPKLTALTQYYDVEAFFGTHSAGTGSDAVSRGLEQIMTNVKWKHTFQGKYRMFLFHFARNRHRYYRRRRM